MSLIAHYPLTDNLLDYSGNKNHGEMIGSLPQSNEGKIGKTFVFGNTSNAIKIPIDINLINELTFSCWIKPLGNHKEYTGALLTSGDWNTDNYFNIGISQNNNELCHYARTKICDYNFNINEWCHLVVQISRSNYIKIYINDDLVYSREYNISLKSSDNFLYIGRASYCNHFPFNGCISDVRIYDECISKLEVKYIYQSLILDYSFNDPYEEPTINMIDDPINFNNFIFKGEDYFTKEICNFDNKKCLKCIVDTTEYPNCWRSIFSLRKNVNKDKYYTMSTWVYVEDKSDNDINDCYFIGATYVRESYRDKTKDLVSNNNYDINSIGTWQHIYIIITPKENVSYFDFDYYIFGKDDEKNYNAKFTIYFYHPQIEEKDHYTPFTKNERIFPILDSSGYKNNSIFELEKIPQFSKKEDEGSGCMIFNGNNRIKVNKLFYDDVNQCHTIFALVNIQSENELQKLINFNNNYYLKFNTYNNIPKTLMYLNNHNNDSYVYGDSLPLNEWKLITWVFDKKKTICSVYYNGILNAQSTNLESTDLPLGMSDNTYIGEGFIGKLQFIKIYATAFSSEEILDFYQTHCKIDKNNNLFVNNIIECNKLKLDKCGLYNNKLIETDEIDNVKFNKDKSIKCNKLYEI